MNQVLELEKEQVLNDFDNKINPWCELYAEQNNIPEEKMCQIAVETFGSSINSTYIRNAIRPEFKQAYRVENAKKKRVEKESKEQTISRLRKTLRNLKDSASENATKLTEPLFETTTYLNGDNKNAKA